MPLSHQSPQSVSPHSAILNDHRRFIRRPVDASERHAGIEATLHAKTSKKDSTASAETADNADATAEQRQETAIAAADAQGGGDANAAPTNEGGCEEADVVALQLPPALRRPKRLSFAKRATGNTEATSALPTPSSPRMGKDAAPLDFAGTLSAPKRYGKDLGASHPVSPRRASNATVPVTGRKSSEVAPASDMESNAGDRTAGQYRLAMSGQDKDGGEYDSHDLLQQDDVQVRGGVGGEGGGGGGSDGWVERWSAGEGGSEGGTVDGTISLPRSHLSLL